MSKRPAPLFVARQSYRRRRLMDAARLLPLVGVFALLLPILWQPMMTPEPDTAFGLAYIFGAWALLIVAARVMARLITRAPTDEGPGDGDDAA